MKIKSMRVVFSPQQQRRCLSFVRDIIKKGMVFQGKYVERLEEQIRKISGLRYALAVGSGTQAIELSCQYFKKFPLKRGNTVIVPVNTFIATALAAEKAGFDVKFVDVESDFLGLDFNEAQKLILRDKNIVGVLPVHIGGFVNPDIKKFTAFCNKHKVWIVEDCAHAFGTEGAGHFGSFGAFSFFSTKVFTSGEGGAVVTNNQKAYQYLQMLRNFGKPNPWESYHVLKGYNYRMNELGAALLSAQLEDWQKIIHERTKIAEQYLNGLDKKFKMVTGKGRQCWYKIIIHVISQAKEIRKILADAGIQCPGSVYEIPLHEMPVYNNAIKKQFPRAEYLCKHHICLPIYLGLKKKQVDCIIKKINQL